MRVPVPVAGSRRGFLVTAAALLLATATMTTPALAANYTFRIRNNTGEPVYVTVSGRVVPNKRVVQPGCTSEPVYVTANAGVSLGAQGAYSRKSISKGVISSGTYTLSISNGKWVLK